MILAAKNEGLPQSELHSFIESIRIRLKDFEEQNLNLSNIGRRLVETSPVLAETDTVSTKAQPGFISDLREIDACLRYELSQLKGTIEKLNALI